MMAPTYYVERGPGHVVLVQGDQGVAWWTTLKKVRMFLVVFVTGDPVHLMDSS